MGTFVVLIADTAFDFSNSLVDTACSFKIWYFQAAASGASSAYRNSGTSAEVEGNEGD